MKLPAVPVKSETVVLAGGMDRISTALMARPGSADLASNYEAVFGGGFQRAGGIERFSGQPRPSDAVYEAFTPASTCALAAGDIVAGFSSGATGVCIYCDSFFAFTKVVGTFILGEEVQVGGITKAVIAAPADITAAIDNTLNALAAAEYRADIDKVPGSGPLRGLSSLKGKVYAWRDNAGGTAMVLHESSTAGWVAVDLYYELTFTVGSVEPAEGDTVARGAASATIKRVVLEGGTWAGSDAAGRYIITAPVGGSFAAGALTTATQGTIPPAGAGIYHGTQIALTAGGRVQTDNFNFTASLDTLRMYGCDGINREFEFDGDVLVPVTIATPTRATAVRCHKNHVFYGFRGSLQHSGIAAPYKFSVISGAGELGTGDIITGLVTVSGSEDQSAMLVLCQDSAYVLFGDDAGDPGWQFTPLSREAGGAAYSAEDCGMPMVYDAPGFRAWQSTDRFGNFQWNLQSRQIDPLIQNKVPRASMFSKAFSRYRVFFTDGTTFSGMPGPKGWEWTQLDYGRNIVLAHSTEISGVTRSFYGDDEGFVYEADVGRSFDGDTITAVCRLHGLNQRAPMVEKTYRYAILETMSDGAFLLQAAAEFDDSDSEKELTDIYSHRLFGSGAFYDVSLYDASYWDTRRQDRKRISLAGGGYNISAIFLSASAEELPHTLKTLTNFYTPRRVARL